MVDLTSSLFWLSIIIILVLVILNGLIAGLTLGLLSLDETKLAVLFNSGNEIQKKAAKRIQPLRKNPHLLLVILLLSSTIINETLPLLLNNIFDGQNIWLSIIVSTSLVLIFSEILPQAISTHYGVQFGYYFSWLVYVLKFFTFPLAYPLAKLLDFMLGKQSGALYKKSELKEFVTLHGQSNGGDLSQDEVKILQGTLSLHGKNIESIMTKLENVFMLSCNTYLDNNVLHSIAQSGHSRIPIYRDFFHNIIGILLVKNLILLDDRIQTHIYDLDLIKPPRMKTTTNLFNALNFFQEGASHMTLIEYNGTVIGICTLEDIIEEILLEEIVDENDQYTDNTHTSKVVRKAKSFKKHFSQVNTTPSLCISPHL